MDKPIAVADLRDGVFEVATLQVNAVSTSARRIAFRTSGRQHGPITRLVSPSDVGELIKPFVFLDHAEVAPDNNGSERALRPTATYRKVTGGFRSTWGADLYAAVRNTVSTARQSSTPSTQSPTPRNPQPL